MGYMDELLKTAKKKGEEKQPAKETATGGTQKRPEKQKARLPESIPVRKPETREGILEAEYVGKRTRIASYGPVEIFRVEGKPLLIYAVPVIKPAGPEKVVVNTIKEAATRLITVAPEDIRDPVRRRNYYFKQVKDIILSSPELGVPQTKVDFYADIVVREMIGYGALDPLTQDDGLEEVMVIGPDRPVYVFHRKYEMLETNIIFGTDEEIRNIISRIARDVNRRVDQSNPMLDARLPDGSRVNATVPPVSLGGSTLTIRKFRADPLTVVDLVRNKTLDPEIAAMLWMAVDGAGGKPANVLVSGGTSSGKTSMLNVLCSLIPSRERIITIEDTAELLLPVDHWVRFETRPPGLEGTGEITMDMLVKNSLRMRPDRIIVGEVRGEEAFTLFSAINTGHQGSMGTLHANSADETITRVLNPPMNVPAAMVGALDMVVTMQRVFDRRKGLIRRVTEIAEVFGVTKEGPQLQVVYEWDPATDRIRETGAPSRYKQTLSKFTGLSKHDIDKELKDRQKFIESMVSKEVSGMKSVIAELRKFGA
ncbi:CpaF family protein [Candidatus Micrarchaeota archaeon]|nr:CpaF family protein [Candidatus Micrarchaeota archaeon]